MSDYLTYMRDARAAVGEEYNKVRDKLMQYDSIVKQLEAKQIEDDTREFTEDWLSVPLSKRDAVAKLGTLDKPVKVKIDRARHKAVMCDEKDLCFVPYEELCEIMYELEKK